MTTSYRTLFRDGLWNNNIVFAQMLGLCPLLAVTSTATNGLGMGLATLAVLIGSNLLIALIRKVINPAVRIPVYIVIIATLVSLIDLLIHAFVYELYKVLGLFIALIVVNCAVLGRAEAFASKNTPLDSVLDALAMGLGFTWALIVIGGVREIIGSGTLFANADLLLGSAFAFLEVTVIPDYKGFLIMVLPPGGFLAMGFLLVLKRWIDQRLAQREKSRNTSTTATMPS